jgi:hypothetical protein
MLVIFQFRIFCLLACYPKTKQLNYIDINAFSFVCVWNSVTLIKGKTQTEGVWEQDAEENIWFQEIGTISLEKIA